MQAWKNLYRRKIINAWNVPPHSSKQTAKVKIQLDSDGNVLSTEIQSNSKEMQDSIRQVILQSAPYPLPGAIQYRQFFYITFTAK
ncbi:TonB C-terminal domain-containing protein [Acinetobacter sp. ANC 5502]